MTKYFILFSALSPNIGRPTVYTTARFAKTETEVRVWFGSAYPDDNIIDVRTGSPFTRAENSKEQKVLDGKEAAHV